MAATTARLRAAFSPQQEAALYLWLADNPAMGQVGGARARSSWQGPWSSPLHPRPPPQMLNSLWLPCGPISTKGLALHRLASPRGARRRVAPAPPCNGDRGEDDEGFGGPVTQPASHIAWPRPASSHAPPHAQRRAVGATWEWYELPLSGSRQRGIVGFAAQTCCTVAPFLVWGQTRPRQTCCTVAPRHGALLHQTQPRQRAQAHLAARARAPLVVRAGHLCPTYPLGAGRTLPTHGSGPWGRSSTAMACLRRRSGQAWEPLTCSARSIEIVATAEWLASRWRAPAPL